MATKKYIEIIPNRLLWTSSTAKFNPDEFTIINIDEQLIYTGFVNDFGPLNLGMTIKFCRMIERVLKKSESQSRPVLHQCSTDLGKRSNAAFLMGAFQIIVLGRTPVAAWEPFSDLRTFLAFRDASKYICMHKCTVLDCLRAIYRAKNLGWIDYQAFDVTEYEFRERVENGDFNWIIPGKFVAMSTPHEANYDINGICLYTPEDYAPVFREIGVTAVIRLNHETYDASRFTQNGVSVHELFFVDGTCPPDPIVDRFLQVCEEEPGALAVHCKAGLGRTGTLIGLYAMKHYKFPAREFIAWNRICRPGSILGPQQTYLLEMEQRCFAWGDAMHDMQAQSPPTKPKTTSSPLYDHIAEHGDHGQAETLVGAKLVNQTPEKPNTEKLMRGVGPKLESIEPPQISPHKSDVEAPNVGLNWGSSIYAYK